jgi:hypothetical protein
MFKFISEIYESWQESRLGKIWEASFEGVTRTGRNGKIDSLKWADVSFIYIITTDGGPFTDDLFYVFETKDYGFVIPSEVTKEIKMFDYFSKAFPDLNLEAMIKACGCIENAIFPLWGSPSDSEPAAVQKQMLP